jgi:hypothetical protein
MRTHHFGHRRTAYILLKILCDMRCSGPERRHQAELQASHVMKFSVRHKISPKRWLTVALERNHDYRATNRSSQWIV